MLQGGTALAIVIAAPLGSFLGGLIGWRGTFLATVPIGAAALAWQFAVLPSMPATESASVSRVFGILRHRIFAIGTAATTLVFIGQNAVSIYFRPFLETVAGLDVNTLSLALLGLGLGGLAGTSLVGFVLRRHLMTVLAGMPAVLTGLALLLIVFGPVAGASAALLILWGVFATPIPVAWGTWMARVIPNDLEPGGGLQVALIQLAIAGGAFFGGALFDAVGWWSTFLFGAVLLTASAVLTIAAKPARA